MWRALCHVALIRGRICDTQALNPLFWELETGMITGVRFDVQGEFRKDATAAPF